jgi:hypothetical protein
LSNCKVEKDSSIQAHFLGCGGAVTGCCDDSATTIAPGGKSKQPKTGEGQLKPPPEASGCTVVRQFITLDDISAMADMSRERSLSNGNSQIDSSEKTASSSLSHAKNPSMQPRLKPAHDKPVAARPVILSDAHPEYGLKPAANSVELDTHEGPKDTDAVRMTLLCI